MVVVGRQWIAFGFLALFLATVWTQPDSDEYERRADGCVEHKVDHRQWLQSWVHDVRVVEVLCR